MNILALDVTRWQHAAADGVDPMPATTNRTSVEKLNAANLGKLPEHLGLAITKSRTAGLPDGSPSAPISYRTLATCSLASA